MHNSVYEFGSEFDWESNNKYINNSDENHFFQGADFFRSGRDALRAIALKYKNKYKRVLLPALCCESMVFPFKATGYELFFYKLNSDLSSDTNDILLKMNHSTIFLYMNYFGINSIQDEDLFYIQERFGNSIFIEDRTHDILAKRGKVYNPDYTICSIRKWISIPDGGILWSSKNLNSLPKVKDTYFSDIRLSAMKDKSIYLKTRNNIIKEKFRKELTDANQYLDVNEIVADMSKKSYEIIKNINFEKIYNQRKINAISLYKQIANIKEVSNLTTTNSLLSTIYHPVLVEKRDEMQNKLAKENIYCPVIWPLPRQAIGICKISDYISNHMLALPCDHRYSINDMEFICKKLVKVLET